MHCEKNIFSKRELSDYDVDVAKGIGDAEYNRTLSEWLPMLFEKHRPHLVFYQAGVDPHMHDALGKLSLTRKGLRERNAQVKFGFWRCEFLAFCLGWEVCCICAFADGSTLWLTNTICAFVQSSVALPLPSHCIKAFCWLALRLSCSRLFHCACQSSSYQMLKRR